jgi:hypothetical protein
MVEARNPHLSALLTPSPFIMGEGKGGGVKKIPLAGNFF